jgi:hypothetical protein
MMASGELGQFVWIVAGTVAIAVPLILHKIRLPRRLQFEELSEGQLSEKQREFLSGFDSKLKELGYAPFATYRIINIGGKNLLRSYTSSADPVRCCVQISAAAKGPVQFDHVEFITDYADGSQAVTTNRRLSATFDCEPDKFLQECRGVDNLGELKHRHEAYTEQFLGRGAVFTERKNFFPQIQRRYEKQVEHQVGRNLLRLDPIKDEFRVTLRWALRLQRNMFNPFADNFTPVKLALAIGVGSLPVMVGLWHGQILSWLEPSASVNADAGWMSLLTLAYAISGVAAGVLFGHKSFVWAFLLAYIPTLLLPAATSHTLGMSLMMGWIADLTFRLQGGRKRLV